METFERFLTYEAIDENVKMEVEEIWRNKGFLVGMLLHLGGDGCTCEEPRPIVPRQTTFKQGHVQPLEKTNDILLFSLRPPTAVGGYSDTFGLMLKGYPSSPFASWVSQMLNLHDQELETS